MLGASFTGVKTGKGNMANSMSIFFFGGYHRPVLKIIELQADLIAGKIFHNQRGLNRPAVQ